MKTYESKDLWTANDKDNQEQRMHERYMIELSH